MGTPRVVSVGLHGLCGGGSDGAAVGVSHLFETFATDPRVLPRFATHASTGEPVPADAVAAMLAQRLPLSSGCLRTHSGRLEV